MALLFVGCSETGGDPAPVAGPAGPDPATLQQQAVAIFGVLPANAATDARPMTDARVELGRMLYFDPRLSKSHDIACNSCHPLDRFGADGEPTSPGEAGQRGDRNSPTSLNAALHLAQFWDGRAEDVEAQAKGPILNPVEMAMPSEEEVVAVLESIPGYPPLFAAAFPDDATPLGYENLAIAIGAFERGLMTPGRFDAFMAGDLDALSEAELAGLQAFIGNGCVSCHMGPAVGGGMYRKLGLVVEYPTEDPGREAVTGLVEDRHVFKVPSLRNVAMTGPWLHDGSVTSLDQMVQTMGRHQLGIELSPEVRASIVAFLESLTSAPDPGYVAPPTLPESGPDTPRPPTASG